MKKYFVLMIIVSLFLVGCVNKVENVKDKLIFNKNNIKITYTGEYTSPDINGKGIMKVEDSNNTTLTTFNGKFVKNEFTEGTVELKYPEQILIRKGTFKNNLLNGKDCYSETRFKNGKTITKTGEFVDDRCINGKLVVVENGVIVNQNDKYGE